MPRIVWSSPAVTLHLTGIACGIMMGLAIAPWVEKAKKILEQGLLILEKRVSGTLHRVRYDPSRWNMPILENREEEEK